VDDAARDDSALRKAVETALDWPVDHVAVAVVGADGAVLAAAGDQDREYRLASVTKPLTAYASLVAVEEGAVEWDTPAGPPGSTIRHLLAHASGLPFEASASELRVQAEPGARRIYSNTGFEVLAAAISEAAGMPFADYLHEAVLAPLGMAATRLRGSAGAGAVSTGADMARFAAELQAPTLVHPETLDDAVHVAFPGLTGVLPGFGRQDPNDWGLGFELRDGKSPHWTGTTSSPATFGHFGQSGTFLWVDPEARVAAVALTDRDFSEWCQQAWPVWTDAVLAALR
jgi:CubicO group peptidase (beta-lactamase class C family)